MGPAGARCPSRRFAIGAGLNSNERRFASKLTALGGAETNALGPNANSFGPSNEALETYLSPLSSFDSASSSSKRRLAIVLEGSGGLVSFGAAGSGLGGANDQPLQADDTHSAFWRFLKR